MENIVNIKNVDPNTLEIQEYQDSDNSLISSFDISDISFNPEVNTLEFHIFDSNKNIINSEYNFKKYSLIDNNLVIDQKENLTSYGFEEGQYYTLYNFINPLFNSNSENKFYISEISSDRTEIRLSSNVIVGLKEAYNNFVSSSNTVSYYKDFYLNFGDNNLIISNNVLLDGDDILIKLYEPLPAQFDIKSELWVIEKLAESIAYFFDIITVLIEDNNIIQIQGPNLNVAIKDKISTSTGYLNYDTLNNSPSASLTNQLNNILSKKAIRLNIDHSDYANFVHFSSAETRLENFIYKLSLIEEYSHSALSSSYSSTNYYLTESKNIYTNKIKDIVEGFDSYEYHLYFNSGSSSWPKSNTVQPYINYPSTASAGLDWATGQLDSASLYDSENKDNLINTIPSYLRDDPRNAPYELYVEMLGQHFDTLYLYTSELNNKYNSDNRVDYGMSKDLISDALKDFGIKIYQNNFSSDDLYTSFLGINSNLGLLPPTGSELISTYTTASSQVIPLEDVNSEIYKRIYHNLPLLLKKKGTVEGLKVLINTYGIPDTVLRVNEFGGKNRNESNDWDQFQNQFNYSFYTTSSGFVKLVTPLQATNPVKTIEFRFKTTGIPTTNLSQSLSHLSSSYGLNVVLEYTGSGYVSSSYSSSIVDPFNEYGTLKFIDSITNTSSSLYLPFFDGGWWSVMVNVNNTAPFTSSIFAKNKIYSGYDGKQMGFEASASVSSSNWYPTDQTLFLSHPGSLTLFGKTYRPFSGSFQELRLYKTKLNESVFDDFVMNPHSIEGNELEGDNSYNSLIFRAPLGSVLESNLSASRISIHPSINITQSFGATTSSIYTLSGFYTFIPNREVYYYDQFPAGIKNIISNKVSHDNTIVPEGDTLSPYISIQQNYPISESYTRDVNYVEVGFSPQNEINEDIISQLGYFNIGNYIGDPRQLVNKKTNQYVDFNKLRDDYFKKYNRPFALGDYIRLIKYFDNSLFKLIKDFVPARTSLATGVIIKQHLLERNRYSPAQVDFEPQDYSGSIKSQTNGFTTGSIYKVVGGNGGMMPNITQSYTESFVGPKGVSSIPHSDNAEFITGEFKGSFITCTTQSLNSSNPFLDINIPYLEYYLKFYYDVEVDEYNFLTNIVPLDGTIVFNANYAKVSKYDANGVLNPNLGTLNSFRIKFSDNTVLEYKILSRTETATYFTYRIEQNTSGLQSDGIILNYQMSSSFSGSISSSSGPSALNLNLVPISTVLVDQRGFLINNQTNWRNPIQMAGITGSFYRINNDYPNIALFVSASVRFTTSGASYRPILYIVKISNFTNDQPPEINTLQNGITAPMEIVNQVLGATNALPQTLEISRKINPTNGDAYFIAFGSQVNNTSVTASNFNFCVTQSVANNTGIKDLITFNPYTSEKFEGSDYDVLYGNADTIQPSQYYDRIDYINYGINNAYFQQILSGSAIPADVKDYYYNLRRHIYPRYMGSRNSSDAFNTSSCENVKSLQNSLKLHLGPSQQQGVVSSYNTAIFEFDNGVPIFEFPFQVGRLNINQVILADNLDEVSSIKPNDKGFEAILNSSIPLNNLSLQYVTSSFTYIGFNFINLSSVTRPSSSLLSVNKYGDTNPTNQFALFPVNVVPKKSIFCIPSDFTNPAGVAIIGGNFAAGSPISSSLLICTGSIPTVTVLNDGTYVTGSLISMTVGTSSVVNTISNGLASGSRYFMSTYSDIKFPLTNGGAPITNWNWLYHTNPVDLNLSGRGIYEIVSCSISASVGILHNKGGGTFTNSKEFGALGVMKQGCLIWEATNFSSYVLVEGSTQDLGSGNFTPADPSPFIQNNLNAIVEKFGNKPKN
jgi:hypothetical protein